MKEKDKSPDNSTIHSRIPLPDSVRERVEFHRHALALLPPHGDKKPGVVFQVGDSRSTGSTRHCTCAMARRKTCPHMLEITQVEKACKPVKNRNEILEKFQAGIWHNLAGILMEGSRASLNSIRLKQVKQPAGRRVHVYNSAGDAIFTYASDGQPLDRFLERCGKQVDLEQIGHRGTILSQLGRLTLSENERIMGERGFRTRRQTLEASFWFRMAYHAYMEYGNAGCRFKAGVKTKSGKFVLTVLDETGTPLFFFGVPRRRVHALLEWFQKNFPDRTPFARHPIPLQMVYRVRLNGAKDLELNACYRFTPEKGKPVYFLKESLSSFRYGDLIYLKDPGVFVPLASPDPRAPRITSDDRMVVKRSRVPNFLNQFMPMLTREPYELDNGLAQLRIFRAFDSAVINPEAIRQDWCWLSVNYKFGQSNVSLVEILRAKKEGKKYLETPEGWVDVNAAPLEGLNTVTDLPLDEPLKDSPNTIRLRRMDVFRVQAASETPFEVAGQQERVALFKRILDMKPVAPLPEMRGFTSTLRGYQKIGVEWLWFLYENGFGGLLCDDMGLGKTHQAMALITCLKASRPAESRYLVVSPTTVLSHWEQKIAAYAPGLTAVVYHGGGRNLEACLADNDVILTSYGILRRDIARLGEIDFTLVVFDEIQYLKNPATQAHLAAARIQAGMKLGMTGTPIENTLNELKAVMDLTVPGYLGGNPDFKARYINGMKNEEQAVPRLGELRRLISPFTLRRKKETVLSDLPEKIEDVRTCRLSADQVNLYREAIGMRAEGIMTALQDAETAVPYIHIFALLTLLKQICDHPVLVQDSVDDFAAHASGKWELFKELLSESLDSGQKVVVYTQFLGMVRIMEKYLAAQSVGYVTLTGASRKRGDIIKRFNEDPDCRVYVGSLKAGGTGVDLVGGSVVIHYDRWWNAAKEDQATDRVHRIGQKRGVQVFKLVTEGTLEEKISAIIMKKRDLMDSIVKEDDPGLLKTFSRAELIGMLSMPEGELMMDE